MLQEADVGPSLLRRWIDRAAEQNPSKDFIVSVDDRRAINYAQFKRLTLQISAFLASRGVGANDRVVLLANNSIEHLACYIGVMAYGATICTIHVEMNHPHLAQILPALHPRLVVYEAGLGLEEVLEKSSLPHLALGTWDCDAHDGFYKSVARCEPVNTALASAGPRDDACVLFTSGTSARPKGVLLTFRELMSNVEPTAAGLGLTRDDRIYDFRSYNWCSAQVLSALGPLCRGATLIMARKFSRSRFFRHIAEYGATISAGNPTTINMLLNADEPVDTEAMASLRFVISSSAPLLPEDWRRFERRFGIPVAQSYGCSEIGWIAANPGVDRHFGTVGKPLPYHQLAIVDERGHPLRTEAIGHIEVGGFPDNDYRYLADDGTIRSISRGRFRTGDMGFLDADGYLHVTGREKDLIIRGGVNISPLEIDSILMQRPEIIEVATIGVPHRTYGEEVVSYVVARPGENIDIKELLHYCSEVLPAFKVPKQIVLSERLPKTARGKLDRKALAQEWTSSNALIDEPDAFAHTRTAKPV
jgi:acyl-coenzyme A synthetase/AMP-(fatty) acid ligase